MVRGRSDGREPLGLAVRRWLVQTGELFRNPVVQRGDGRRAYHLYFGRPLVCFNSLHLEASPGARSPAAARPSTCTSPTW